MPQIGRDYYACFFHWYVEVMSVLFQHYASSYLNGRDVAELDPILMHLDFKMQLVTMLHYVAIDWMARRGSDVCPAASQSATGGLP